MLVTENLTEIQWQIAHAIAQTLVKENTDVNELGKAIAYLRNAVNQDPTSASAKFFKYLKTLVSNGRQIGHSGRTSDYYRSIDKACSQYLQNQPIPSHTLLQILGWTARLMRYYKEGGAIGEITDAMLAAEPARQAKITQLTQSQTFTLNQELEAKVLNIKGNKVTYEIPVTSQKFTEKEPKKAASLTEGQIVKVKITALKEDGIIKNVKCGD